MTSIQAQEFAAQNELDIQAQGENQALQALATDFYNEAAKHKYSYHFSWMGRPIIQLPQDMVAMQEIIWQLKPDLIIECGIAHGGSIIYYASILELLGHGEVLGIDLDIRAHNREAIESHPMAKRISMIEGSSIDPAIAAQVHAMAQGKKVIVVLDSNHTHEHVLEELRLYAPLVAVGSYCVVMDTIVEHMPAEAFPDRPWGPGDNPKTAVWAWLQETADFQIDQRLNNKLLLSVAPDGYLLRVK